MNIIYRWFTSKNKRVTFELTPPNITNEPEPPIIISNDKRDVKIIENDIINDMIYYGSLDNTIMTKSLYDIQTSMRNNCSLKYSQLEYIHRLDKEDIYLLLVLMNECTKNMKHCLDLHKKENEGLVLSNEKIDELSSHII